MNIDRLLDFPNDPTPLNERLLGDEEQAVVGRNLELDPPAVLGYPEPLVRRTVRDELDCEFVMVKRRWWAELEFGR